MDELVNVVGIKFQNFSGTIHLQPYQVLENPFVTKDGHARFYQFIRSLFEFENNKVANIDCRKINVAKNIQNAWYNYAAEYGLDQTALSMDLCLCGPTAVDYLPDNTVEFLPGCLTFVEEKGE